MMKLLKYLFLLPLVAHAALTDVDRAELPNFNILKNPGFENGDAQWSKTGSSTLSIEVSGSNLIKGLRSATWDASTTGEFLRSALVAIPVGLQGQNCLARIKYKGGDANIKLNATDGTNKLASLVLSTATNPQYAYVTFPCPTSGNLRLELESTANAVAISVDEGHLGDNSLLGTISTITSWQSYTPTVSNLGAGSSTTTGKWRRVGDSAEIEIKLTKDATPGSGASVVYYSLPSVVVVDRNKTANSSATSTVGVAYTYDVETTSQQDSHAVALRVSDNNQVCVINNGGTDCFHGADYRANSSASLNFKVPVVGWQSEMAIRPDNVGLTDWVSYTPVLETGAGGTDCTNVTNTGRWRRVGDSMEVSMRVLFNGAPATCSSSFLRVALPVGYTIDTSKLPTTQYHPVGTVYGRDLGTASYNGVAYADTTTQLSIDAVDVSGANYTWNFTQPITWGTNDNFEVSAIVPIVGWSNSMPAPLLVGSITSNSTGLERIERANINWAAGVPSIIGQSGSWVSSLTDQGAGDVILNLVAGIFPNNPTCTCSTSDSSNRFKCHFISMTNSGLRVQMTPGATDTPSDMSGTGNSLNIICVGSR